MADKKEQAVTFVIGKNGQLALQDFAPRSMKSALKPLLKKGWKKSPSLLVKAMRASPDLMGMTLSIRNSFANFLETKRVDIEAQIGEKTEKILSDPKNAANKKFDPSKNKELKKLYEMLNVVDVLLWAIDEHSVYDWVVTLSEEQYEMVVDTISETLKGDVTEDSFVFNRAYDTPEGFAVTLMTELSPEILNSLDVRFGWVDTFEAPLTVSTGKTAEELNKVSKDLDLGIRFEGTQATQSAEAPKAAKKAKKAPAKTKTA